MAAVLPLSAKELFRFTPSRKAGDAEGPAPVYLIKPATLAERARWRRDIATARARQVDHSELRAHLRDAISALLPADDRRRALEDVELASDWIAKRTDGKPLEEKDLPAELATALVHVAELELWAQSNWPPYAEVAAAREYWWEMCWILAARHFLRGWENVSVRCDACDGTGHLEAPAAAEGEPPPDPPPCARCEGRGRVALKFAAGGDGLITEDLFSKLPWADVHDIGLKAMNLMSPDAAQRKN